MTCAFVTILYVVSHVGFGIHCCNAEGAKYLVPMLGDVSDEAVHAHHHDFCHGCGEERHHCDGACGISRCIGDCTTQVYVVDDDQDSGYDTTRLLPVQTEFLDCSLICAGPVPDRCITLTAGTAPPSHLIRERMTSVWRL